MGDDVDDDHDCDDDENIVENINKSNSVCINNNLQYSTVDIHMHLNFYMYIHFKILIRSEAYEAMRHIALPNQLIQLALLKMH